MRVGLNLRPLTWILIVIFLLVLALALAPRVAELRSGRFQLLVVLFAGLVLLIGLWAIRRTNLRLARLTAVAEAIEAGHYDARATESGEDSVAELAAAINRMAERTGRVVEELTSRDERLRFLANYDALTSLPNRRLFRELLARELAHSRRAGDRLAVVVLDIDRFKAFNDSYGSAFGDRLLRRVAERLATALREADTVSRLSGDEFALILPKAQREADLVGAIRRLLEVIGEPLEIGGREILLSASAGMSLFPDSGDDPEQLLARAGESLLRAKEEGGGRLKVFDPSHRWGRAHLEFEQELRRAIRAGQLTVYYQPQVSLADGRVVGTEGLVRWLHPERGVVSAGAFIPVAERIGLMPDLGAWLVDEICRQSAAWQRDGLPVCPVSVNVSARQFQAGDVVPVIEAALEHHRLDPARLHVEITESIAMHDLEQVNETLGGLRTLGVKVHLDDFGTGYSSLSFLLRHPVDVLKIDRSFIADITRSEHSAAIVRATIALTRSLGLGLIAEGIETEDQLAFLRQAGCEAAQGFLLSHPLPADRMGAILKTGVIELPAVFG